MGVEVVVVSSREIRHASHAANMQRAPRMDRGMDAMKEVGEDKERTNVLVSNWFHRCGFH